MRFLRTPVRNIGIILPKVLVSQSLGLKSLGSKQIDQPAQRFATHPVPKQIIITVCGIKKERTETLQRNTPYANMRLRRECLSECKERKWNVWHFSFVWRFIAHRYWMLVHIENWSPKIPFRVAYRSHGSWRAQATRNSNVASTYGYNVMYFYCFSTLLFIL